MGDGGGADAAFVGPAPLPRGVFMISCKSPSIR